MVPLAAEELAHGLSLASSRLRPELVLETGQHVVDASSRITFSNEVTDLVVDSRELRELVAGHALAGPARCAGEVLDEPRCDGILHVEVLGHGPELHLLDVVAECAWISIPAWDESPSAVLGFRHVEQSVDGG